MNIEESFYDIPFKVLSIEKVIKKRLDLIKQYLLFKENKQYILHSNPPASPFDIYRKLNIEDGLFEKSEKVKNRLAIRMKYLLKEVANLGEVTIREDYRDNTFKVQLEQ